MSTSEVIKTKERKKLNRKSKLFYVSCDYVDVNNDEGQQGYVLNVHSEPLNIFVDQNAKKAERERKKQNRKSKLFYVSCEHFDVGGQGGVSTFSFSGTRPEVFFKKILNKFLNIHRKITSLECLLRDSSTGILTF